MKRLRTKIGTTASSIDRTAISPYDNYCDGYSNPGAQGNGYVAVLKVSTGTVQKTDDFLLDDIVSYDRAEANDAYIGQINMETASSFCGISGQVWGYDLAQADDIATQDPLFTAKQYDDSDLLVYDAAPLLNAGQQLFGTVDDRRFPPAPGSHVVCANKSALALRPVDESKINKDEFDGTHAYGVWCYIALSITKDRDNSADLFIEDCGYWIQDNSETNLKEYLQNHRHSVVASIVACGENQRVLYDRTYISYAYTIMAPGYVGTALTVAPYITLAKNAIPAGGFDELNNMTLSTWLAQLPTYTQVSEQNVRKTLDCLA